MRGGARLMDVTGRRRGVGEDGAGEGTNVPGALGRGGRADEITDMGSTCTGRPHTMRVNDMGSRVVAVVDKTSRA